MKAIKLIKELYFTKSNKARRWADIDVFLNYSVENSGLNVKMEYIPAIVSYKSHDALESVPFDHTGKCVDRTLHQ